MGSNPLTVKLAAVRQRIRLLMAANSLFRFVATAGVAAVASFLLDWLFHLPWGARLVMLAIILGVMIRGAFESFLRPFSIALTDDTVALHVQAHKPGLGDDIITAVQLGRALDDPRNSESKSMMAAAVADITGRLAGVDFSDSVRLGTLARPAATAALLALVLFSYTLWQPAHAGLWARRCLLLSDETWPPDTVLDVRIANLDLYRHEVDDRGIHQVWVPEGSVIQIEALARGEIPHAVTLHKVGLDDEASRPITIEIARNEGSPLFEYRFGRVRRSFAFHVTGGDDQDLNPLFNVHVRRAPRIESLSVSYDYPDYINDVGLEDRSDVREYNIVAPRGTRVTMEFSTSTEVVEFDIIVDEKPDSMVRLAPVSEKHRRFLWSFDLNEDHFYTYRLVGANGAPSREAPNFNMTAQADVPPDIAIRMPDTPTVDVTRNAVLPLKFQVMDDYRVGSIALRWDRTRDGAFSSIRAFRPEEIRAQDGEREQSVFAALPVPELVVEKESGHRAPEVGDRVLLKLEATDTRRTRMSPEPNTTVYPSLIVLNVREGNEIERDLVRTQIRIKGQVARMENALTIRQEELAGLLRLWQNPPSDQEAPDIEESLHRFISAHALLTSGLNEAARGFVRVFDGYLFNRLDDSNLTETLIAALCQAHAQGDEDHMTWLGDILPRHRQLINATEPMGKLTLIMDGLLTAAVTSSRKVDRTFKTALNVEGGEGRLDAMRSALEAQKALLEELRAILSKMEDWEDFQDVIQSLKDIIDLERSLQNRIKKIAK